jgi:hypothetical protein
MGRRLIRVIVGLTLIAAWNHTAVAQTPIPPPSGPVVFCAEQTPPAADSYQLRFDGGALEPLTMDASLDSACAGVSGATHSFRLPAARFTVGTHTLQVRARNAFGSTDGPVFSVVVGIAPGPLTIKAVIAPSGGGLE